MSFSELANFIWGVADLLRGDYKRADFGKVILPFTLLRRLECVLEPTKAKVLKEQEKYGSSGFRVGKGVLGLHQAPPQASITPLCAISNCTKSSWDLRRRGESRQWRCRKPQAIPRWARLRCAWGGRQTCRYTALSVMPWYPVTIPVRDVGAI